MASVGRVHELCPVEALYQYVVLYVLSNAVLQPSGRGISSEPSESFLVSSSAAATASTLMPLARSLFFKKGGNSCGIPSLLSQGADRRRRWPECSSTNISHRKQKWFFLGKVLKKERQRLTASSPPYAHTRAARVALCTEYRRALKSFYHACRDAAWCFVISSSPSSCGR